MEARDQELISSLTEAISMLATNPVPLDQRLWNADDCAQYLRMEKKTFQNHYAPHPNFPKPFQLARAGGGGRVLWRASEVIAWAMKKK